MNLYIICGFLFIFKGLKKGAFDGIQANDFAVRIMKVQSPIFYKNLTFFIWVSMYLKPIQIWNNEKKITNNVQIHIY